MNTVETSTIVCPDNKTDECAKFIIDDGTFVYTLSDVMMVGRNYTFSCWTKSEADGMIVVSGSATETSTDWQYFAHTFTSDNTDLSIGFATAGAYYIYHPKLEIGTIATDWSPAPEDLDSEEALSEINDRVQTIHSSISDLIVNINGISGRVENTEKNIDTISGDLLSAQNEIASMKLESDNLKLEFQDITENGVKRVSTETGFTFDREGMTVDASDSSTKTQVTPDGMTVYKKDADGVAEEVLEATSEGVNATNLYATTYLIVGGRSRFENYGNNRTGCFWIGG